MTESDLEKAVKEIKKDIDTLKALKKEMDSVFDEPKDTDKKEEREFQLEILKAQSFITNINSYFTVLTAVSFSLFGILYVITNSILIESTITTGNFTNGTTIWTGKFVGVTYVSPTALLYMSLAEWSFLILGFVGLASLYYFLRYGASKRINRIRKPKEEEKKP